MLCDGNEIECKDKVQNDSVGHNSAENIEIYSRDMPEKRDLPGSALSVKTVLESF